MGKRGERRGTGAGESIILGVTIVTPIRNDHGRFRSPHANVLGRLAPNCLPT